MNKEMEERRKDLLRKSEEALKGAKYHEDLVEKLRNDVRVFREDMQGQGEKGLESNDDKEKRLGIEIRELGEKIKQAIESNVKIEDYDNIKSEMADIEEIIAEGTPLTTGKILIKLADILFQIDKVKFAGLIKDCYILSFELALENITDMAKQMQKKKESAKEDGEKERY